MPYLLHSLHLHWPRTSPQPSLVTLTPSQGRSRPPQATKFSSKKKKKLKKLKFYLKFYYFFLILASTIFFFQFSSPTWGWLRPCSLRWTPSTPHTVVVLMGFTDLHVLSPILVPSGRSRSFLSLPL